MRQKIRNRHFVLVILGLAGILVTSCSKNDENGDPPPTVKAPVLTTTNISAISETSAQCGGTISNDGGSAVTARGVCWSTDTMPVISDFKTINGNGAGNFTSTMTGLTQSTTYYVRAYASNSAGTGYGGVFSFTTSQQVNGTVTDIEGNIYHTLLIGSQVWMVENLKTTKFRDGSSIQLETADSTWSTLTTPGCCWYANDINNTAIYGLLYNWFAVNTGQLAPAGWHIPSDAEWTILMDFLGGKPDAGGKMKSTGTVEAGSGYWSAPNTGATNESGFSGLPGGIRRTDGSYFLFGLGGFWYASTEDNATKAWFCGLTYDGAQSTFGSAYKNNGLSVRCLQSLYK
jgi:uncharacterized protein (TIGR02145 family)